MNALDIARDLVAHMEWADATVWNAVRKLGTGDAKLADRLRHYHATQHAFLMIWRNEPVDFSNVPQDVEQWARDYYTKLAAFMAPLDERSLDRVLNIPWAERYAKNAVSKTTLGDTILQVTSHSAYHRGQVNTRIRELGGEPPLVDYIAWLWLGKPSSPSMHPSA